MSLSRAEDTHLGTRKMAMALDRVLPVRLRPWEALRRCWGYSVVQEWPLKASGWDGRRCQRPMETPVAPGRLVAWEERQPESCGARKGQMLLCLQS